MVPCYGDHFISHNVLRILDNQCAGVLGIDVLTNSSSRPTIGPMGGPNSEVLVKGKSSKLDRVSLKDR